MHYSVLTLSETLSRELGQIKDNKWKFKEGTILRICLSNYLLADYKNKC